MWVTWLVIGLAVMMVLGPVLMIKPTNRQKRSAKLRVLAAENGMLVKLGQLQTKPNASVTIYILPVNNEAESKKVKNSEWLLERRDYRHEIHFCGEWDWCGHEKPEEKYFSALEAFVRNLPHSYSGVGKNTIGVFLYWDEKCLAGEESVAIKDVQKHLKALASLLSLSVH